MQKNELENIFVNQKYKNYSKNTLLSELKTYLNDGPSYINEIKNFLRDNDLDLFHSYGLCFKHNPGVKCAFGIEYDASKSELQYTHIKFFVTYKPVFSEADNLHEPRMQCKKPNNEKNRNTNKRKYRKK